jgi:hypothetical protein
MLHKFSQQHVGYRGNQTGCKERFTRLSRLSNKEDIRNQLERINNYLVFSSIFRTFKQIEIMSI